MESESQGFVLTFFHYNTRSYPRQETLLLHKFFSGLNFLQNSRAPTLCFTRQSKNMIFSYIINRPPSSTRFHELYESTNMTFSYILHELFWSPYRNECPAKVILYTTICSFVFQDRKFLITCGLDGFVVKTLTSGVCPPSSVLELLAEVKYFARSV